MRPLSLLIATLAVPASVAFAQVPTTPGTTGGQAQYIPLIGSGGGANGAAGNAAWFIDTTQSQIVLCTQTSPGAPNFTCSAQPVPTAVATPTTPPQAGEAPPQGGETPPQAGGEGANPLGG